MKAIIRGKRYDTNKAELIGGADGGGESVTDWHYWEESLYRTPTSKQYFIAGSGGPLSAWGQNIGQSGRRGSSGIKPLSAEEATGLGLASPASQAGRRSLWRPDRGCVTMLVFLFIVVWVMMMYAMKDW